MEQLEIINESQAGMLRLYQQWLADKEYQLAEALAKNQLLNQQNAALQQKNEELLEELTEPTE